MDTLFVAWFMIDAPHPLPVLLYAREGGSDQNTLEIVNRVYKFATEKAQACGIHRTIHIGLYHAYHSLLTSCLAAN